VTSTGSVSSALALVESPAQLLNVIELAYADPELAGVRIAVLAPTVGPTRVQLRAMVGLARQAGHEVAWLEPRMGGASVARTVAALAGDLGKVDRLVVGDPFSGVIQVIINVTRAHEVTIVDDGTATLEFARQWVAGEHLSRWHRVATPQQRRQISELARDQIAGTLRRRLSPELGCRLRLFTSMPVELPKVAILGNDYGWVRAHAGRPEVKLTADLVGTSLVESGVVEGEAYLMGVERLLARHGVDRYFAHRKEADWKLDLIGRMGVQVVRPDLPLEIVARRGPIGARVLSFPSTVVHTLPVVLAGVAAELVVCPIPGSWYAPGATRRADTFLDYVTTSASRRHGLLEMAC
jgi:hypothetical protein